jgi:NhaP-type Na+/H+ or K+/H+ antiporter
MNRPHEEDKSETVEVLLISFQAPTWQGALSLSWFASAGVVGVAVALLVERMWIKEITAMSSPPNQVIEAGE